MYCSKQSSGQMTLVGRVSLECWVRAQPDESGLVWCTQVGDRVQYQDMSGSCLSDEPDESGSCADALERCGSRQTGLVLGQMHLVSAVVGGKADASGFGYCTYG